MVLIYQPHLASQLFQHQNRPSKVFSTFIRNFIYTSRACESRRADFKDNMEHPDHVALWLEGLGLESSDRDTSQGSQLENSRERIQIITPLRRSSVVQIPDHSSPITSIFSDETLFDAPLRKDIPLRAPTCNQFYADFSDHTSIDGEDNAGGVSEKPCLISNYTQQFHISTASLDSCDPPSSVHSDFDDPLGHIVQSGREDNHNPDLPRVVNITSCLQCTLANLPCSRTTPCCTRCVRNGYGDTCLLTRRLFPEEIIQAGSAGPRRLVLLKVKGENDEVWATKMELKDRLLEQWQMQKDRKNWVFPSLDGGMGERRGSNAELKKGDWEGVGRVVFKVLCVHVEATG